jgi:YbbR domain-containing protein
MIKKKNKPSKQWIKKGPLKTFLFFLGFSAVIWIFVQFSKQYTVPVEVPVSYVNAPKDKILADNRENSLELRLRDNGFKIARYRLMPPELQIDLSEARVEDNNLIYELEQQKQAIVSQLNLSYENTAFLQQDIKIGFEQKEVKTVRVVSNIELGFAVGYSALDEIELEPDSIRVSGPASVLDTLEEVGTRALRINNINRDISGKVQLETKGLNNVTFFRNEVNYNLRTDKFTEGKVEIPIEVINVPAEQNVVIFPKEVALFYQVSLKDFEKVKASSFKVVVDFEHALASEGYLLAQVVEKPSFVNNVRLNERSIQFVIRR